MGKSNSGAAVKGAQIQGEISEDLATNQTYANRPDQFNPFGSLTWQQESVFDPVLDDYVTKWTQNHQLSEPLQNILGHTTNSLEQRSELANSLNDRVAHEMGQAPDWHQFGAMKQLEYDPSQVRQNAEDAVYNQATSRLDPRFQQAESDLDIKLRNQGLKPGDEAYDRAYMNMQRSKNDAYNQAMFSANGAGRAEAGQMYDQQLKSTDYANQLRKNQIAEYIGQREYTLDQQKQLDPTGDIQSIISALGAGG